MKRLEKGDSYWFISSIDYKVVPTHDWHFLTDDERFENGNYFTDPALAKKCAAQIDDEYGDQLEKLNAALNKCKEDFFKTAGELAEKAKKKTVQVETYVEVAKALAEAHTTYREKRLELNKQISEVKKDIEAIISSYTL